MKALSIRQPWADAIIHGGKDIENRTWGTGYTGPILIHASKQIERHAYPECVRRGYTPSALPPTGGIIGVAYLCDCVLQSDSKWFERGGYGLLLAYVEPVPFTPLAGQLGLFEVDELALRDATWDALQQWGESLPQVMM